MSQTMKPVTAAAKLGIFLPAAPDDFRTTPITRDELDALRADPPQWLADLQRNGPFPRDVVARSSASLAPVWSGQGSPTR